MPEILYIFNYKSRKTTLKLFLHYSQKLSKTYIHQKKQSNHFLLPGLCFQSAWKIDVKMYWSVFKDLQSCPVAMGGKRKSFYSPAHYEKCRCEIAGCCLKSFAVSVSVSILKWTACTLACLANVACGSCSWLTYVYIFIYKVKLMVKRVQ